MKFLKVFFILVMVLGAVGGFFAWRSGMCRDWMSEGSWSEWSACDDEGQESEPEPA